MAKCRVCRLEMLRANSCTVKHLYFLPYKRTRGGLRKLSRAGAFLVPRLVFGVEEWCFRKAARDIPKRCWDCGVKRGNCHHPGCEVEECRRCHHQLLTCECEDGEYANVPPQVVQ